MKLTDLHPEHAIASEGRWQLSFDCPTTPGGRIGLFFRRGSQSPGVWQCTSEFTVYPGLEHLGAQPVIPRLTLVPSIGEHTCRKRGYVCQGHVSIINGEVVRSG